MASFYAEPQGVLPWGGPVNILYKTQREEETPRPGTRTVCPHNPGAVNTASTLGLHTSIFNSTQWARRLFSLQLELETAKLRQRNGASQFVSYLIWLTVPHLGNQMGNDRAK